MTFSVLLPPLTTTLMNLQVVTFFPWPEFQAEA